MTWTWRLEVDSKKRRINMGSSSTAGTRYIAQIMTGLELKEKQ